MSEIKEYSSLGIDFSGVPGGGSDPTDTFQIPPNRDKVTVTVLYSDIDADDVTMKLVQSIDSVNWQDVENSEVTIDKALPSHTWNLAGYTPGLHLGLAYDQGSATAGTIDELKFLG